MNQQENQDPFDQWRQSEADHDEWRKQMIARQDAGEEFEFHSALKGDSSGVWVPGPHKFYGKPSDYRLAIGREV